MQRLMPTTDDEPQIGERARLAELLQIMGRHGFNGLASRLGLLPGVWVGGLGAPQRRCRCWPCPPPTRRPPCACPPSPCRRRRDVDRPDHLDHSLLAGHPLAGAG